MPKMRCYILNTLLSSTSVTVLLVLPGAALTLHLYYRKTVPSGEDNNRIISKSLWDKLPVSKNAKFLKLNIKH
jgi:hypothetical protein